MNPLPLRSRAPQLLLASMLLAACASDAPGERFSVRDSAGVRYIEHRSIDSLPARTTGEEGVVRIGAASGDAGGLLDRVAAGAVLSDGRVVLLNAGDREVRFYDANGALVAAQGREGDGPEEYRNPTTLVAIDGDSVVVWDVAHKRATVVGPDGTVARSATLPGELRFPLLAGVFGNGNLLVVDRSLSFTPGDSVQTEMAHDLLFSPTGEPRKKIGDHPLRVVQLMSEGAPVAALGPRQSVEIRAVPFSPETQRAARSDGYWVGRQRGPELAFIDSAGTLRTIVRWLAPPVAVTDADKRAYLDELIAQAPDEEARASLRTQGVAFFQYADRFPAHGPLVPASDGSLWMSEYRRPGVSGPERWTVLDAQGVARERVELPQGSRLLWASPERVLLLLRDERGVERVELRPLRSASSDTSG